MTASPYVERRTARSRFLNVRGLRYHVLQWGGDELAAPDTVSNHARQKWFWWTQLETFFLSYVPQIALGDATRDALSSVCFHFVFIPTQ
jgi:hypothetical protein